MISRSRVQKAVGVLTVLAAGYVFYRGVVKYCTAEKAYAAAEEAFKTALNARPDHKAWSRVATSVGAAYRYNDPAFAHKVHALMCCAPTLQPLPPGLPPFADFFSKVQLDFQNLTLEAAKKIGLTQKQAFAEIVSGNITSAPPLPAWTSYPSEVVFDFVLYEFGVLGLGAAVFSAIEPRAQD